MRTEGRWRKRPSGCQPGWTGRVWSGPQAGRGHEHATDGDRRDRRSPPPPHKPTTRRRALAPGYGAWIGCGTMVRHLPTSSLPRRSSKSGETLRRGITSACRLSKSIGRVHGSFIEHRSTLVDERSSHEYRADRYLRLGPDQVGLQGLLLLGAAGLVGVGLAVHGYGRGVVIASGPGGLGSPASVAGSHGRTSTTTRSTTTTGRPTTSRSTTTPSRKLGPLLSSTQYAPYALRVYPGPESSQTRQGTAGFTIRVTPHARTIELSVAASGSGQAAQTSTFPAGDRVYFIEASLGDESGSVDYNFGDDGVVVTNARGYIVQ